MAKFTVLIKPTRKWSAGDVTGVYEDTHEWASASRTDHLMVEVEGPTSAWLWLLTEQTAPRVKRIDSKEQADRQAIWDATMTRLSALPIEERRKKAAGLLGYDDDFEADIWYEEPVTKPRRYYVDLAKLEAAQQANNAERIALRATRDLAERKVIAGRHALEQVKTRVERDTVWNDGFSWQHPDDLEPLIYDKGLSHYIGLYADAVAALEAAKPTTPVTMPGTIKDGVGSSRWIIDRGEGVLG